MYSDLPHVDEILRKRDRIRVAGYGDGPIGAAAFALLAIRYPDHSARDLADFGDLGAALQLNARLIFEESDLYNSSDVTRRR